MSQTKEILIVEDESGIRQLITFALQHEGFSFSEAKSLQTAQHQLSEHTPDLIILDWMLPDGNGVSLLQQLRKRSETANIPIIMLTARSSEQDVIKGLDSGADDYLTKPFSIAELTARINALLRRANSDESSDVIEWKGIVVNSETHEVTCQGQTVTLHRREFQLLKVFISQPGKVHEREQLIHKVWGDFAEVGDRVVDVAVRRLRKAFEGIDYELPISTIRGIGYRLDKS
ncbi:response regulator [Suttonella sp. R2A3]|uniref:response regulator n=1 Tax=Suttonella sp. R2A3 TaxID=2908648 RepID=UPI001F21F9A5|nr:response regulator [Suttonella sp. R2A3]UJF25395.1 response regulator [Suttonella sp. R2A3]